MVGSVDRDVVVAVLGARRAAPAPAPGGSAPRPRDPVRGEDSAGPAGVTR